MQLRVFGRTGMQLSVLGFGCGAVGGLMVRGDPADQERTVARAIAALCPPGPRSALAAISSGRVAAPDGARDLWIDAHGRHLVDRIPSRLRNTDRRLVPGLRHLGLRQRAVRLDRHHRCFRPHLRCQVSKRLGGEDERVVVHLPQVLRAVLAAGEMRVESGGD